MQELIRDILKQYWGYDEFRPLQEDIILSVLQGKDTLGLMPTGGGKSITFQVPALAVEGIALVITPLIALMKDQVDNLRKRGIKAAYIHSGITRREMIVTLENCIYGRFKFLYISPERLSTSLFRQKLKELPVSFIVVDEAHCISQWGYDFRPSYLQIASIREQLPGIPVLALTATATPEVVKEIQDKLLFRKENVYKKSFRRSNLIYVVRKGENKIQELLRVLHRVPGSAIVYVRSRKKTKEIAGELIRNGINADYYHAGLSIEDKNLKQQRWTCNDCRVIVATNAFGMGIDKADVKTVIHFDLPNSPEEYYQEAGRAGRNGEKSYAVILYSKSDKASLKRRLSDLFPEKEFILRIYEAAGNFLNVAIGYGKDELYEFNLNTFCKTFKFPVLQTFNALKILTQAGYIEFVEEEETLSRVMMQMKKDELYSLPKEDPVADCILQCLLRSYTGLFADYVFINEELLRQRTNLTQQEIYEGLIRLNRLHVLHYIPRKRTPFILYTAGREEPRHLIIPKKVYEERKERFEHRINSMLQYVAEDERCRGNMLLQYFGEKTGEECGNCDICISRRSEKLSSARFGRIESDIRRILDQGPCERARLIEILPYPREQVIETLRFLCDEEYINCEAGHTYKINS